MEMNDKYIQYSYRFVAVTFSASHSESEAALPLFSWDMPNL